MSENNSKERKKLSLSSGKLTLKSNLYSNKTPSSVTTNSRSGRNTVQVEVKRSKRSFENKFISKYDQNGINSTLSAEQIAKRSKELKDGLARTAALAENEVFNTKNNLELKNSIKKDEIKSNEKLHNIKTTSLNDKNKFQEEKKSDDNKYSKKTTNRDAFKDNTKKVIPKGYEKKREGKLTIARALDSENVRFRSLASIKRRREKVKLQSEVSTPAVKQIRDVIIPDTIVVSELANRMSEKTADVVRELMKNGIMATATQVIDADTAELITNEFGHKVKRVSDSDIELDLVNNNKTSQNLISRPPVVTIMGHVDHGKTSLLDSLRKTNVVKSEAGGITQHIGAYQIKSKNGNLISFIDTPGHEAFSEMRARGANITDIVILVVAADDGIKQQTIEAINHAKSAKVPIIVAVNKCDKPDIDPQKVKNELLQHELIPEDMGGDVQCIHVSALKKTGLDQLIEAIELQAEILELKSDPDCPATGIVIESKLEKGKGSVITLLVNSGTIRVGDIIVVGTESGKVRALINDLGERVDEAVPSTPIEVLGLSGTPMAGDIANVVDSESKAREVAEYRSRKFKEKEAALSSRGSVEQMLANIQSGEITELPVVIKTDVHGSLEAIKVALTKLGDEKIKVKILSGSVGPINESDISLAVASSALVFGFNVRAIPQAREIAKRDLVEIRYHSIIYELIEDAKNGLSGMLDPDLQEEFIGYAEIKQVFNITNHGKIAGCSVTEGIIKRGCSFRLLRENIVVHEGKLKTLQRFKDEVKEVKFGLECGMGLENYNDIKVGDIMECFEVKEIKKTL
ncbi:MAG: translation initiation factor IF-2 [Alphaproteobacteria bacterium]|nr:MAG: translation initiation factor IF-2 [Alphaproteobacteria bacterium]